MQIHGLYDLLSRNCKHTNKIHPSLPVRIDAGTHLHAPAWLILGIDARKLPTKFCEIELYVLLVMFPNWIELILLCVCYSCAPLQLFKMLKTNDNPIWSAGNGLWFKITGYYMHPDTSKPIRSKVLFHFIWWSDEFCIHLIGAGGFKLRSHIVMDKWGQTAHWVVGLWDVHENKSPLNSRRCTEDFATDFHGWLKSHTAWCWPVTQEWVNTPVSMKGDRWIRQQYSPQWRQLIRNGPSIFRCPYMCVMHDMLSRGEWCSLLTNRYTLPSDTEFEELKLQQIVSYAFCLLAKLGKTHRIFVRLLQINSSWSAVQRLKVVVCHVMTNVGTILAEHKSITL